MISRGDMESNRKKVAQAGLTFPVAVQQNWGTSKDYGMFATPIAYLIDERGVIVSDVAAGEGAIRALTAGPAATNGHADHHHTNNGFARKEEVMPMRG